jgi:hypothetical protein
MAATRKLLITFDAHADPVTGTVRDEQGQTAPFTGYVDLIAAIERHRSAATESHREERGEEANR